MTDWAKFRSRKAPNLVLALIVALSLSSCGYRFGRGELLERYSTVCIPYVEGDESGIFTTRLIQAMSERGALSYVNYSADLSLNVCLLPPDDLNIGFIYAPDKQEKKPSKVTTANEARLRMRAQVSLLDRRTGCSIFGPLLVESWLDYDFEPDLGDINENRFSLGQLEMHNIAQDATFPPLYTLLAEKIVDYVNNCW